LCQKQAGTKETVLETSIRMIRQYGLGYVFVDQSASLLSKVAFANSYATLAMSQKLRADVQAIAGAMNLTDEQREALSTLSVGSAVVRLADEHPEPFLVKIPRSPIREGSVTDSMIQARMDACSTKSAAEQPPLALSPVISDLPPADKKHESKRESVESHPPTPKESCQPIGSFRLRHDSEPPPEPLSRDAIRFLTDVATRPLS
ncbi:unnamed protein product, partial [marine sediment metagenome]